ncbi:MAG: RNA polymerase factor sigma-54 [Candidatus Marinimicrobia bacterium]|nr:RNA polymerase factor sigma-54 [Candidatus Neomarinimicrobiota bacterium]
MPYLAQTQKLAQHLSPQQILQSSILQLNSLMIEARILQELELNPALELTDEELAPPEDDTLDDNQEEEIDWDELLNAPEDFNVNRYRDNSREEIEVQLAAAEEFVEEFIRKLRDLGLAGRDIDIAFELIGNINNEGYLTVEPLLIADRLQISEEKVETVREQIMQVNPPGVGALDLQECLLAQLRAGEENGLATKIVEQHFDDFANRRFSKVIQALGCTEEELQAAIEVISHLNPKPGMGGATTMGEYIVPDILLDEVNGEWVITLNDTSLPEIHISPVYVNMITGRDKYDTETRQFARKKVEAAKWFIQAVQQRRHTIMRVVEAIIRRQEKFFRQEGGPLKPMVLRDIAEDVSMDISTISRVTNGKYVQTPHRIYELKYFFSEGMTTNAGEEVSTRLIKDELQKIVNGEDKQKPFNDETLAAKLKERGYPVARRTVAKYREQLTLPVARLRREL